MITNHKGTSQNSWLIGDGTSALKIVNNSGILEIQDYSGNVIVSRSAGIPISSVNDGDIATYRDVQDSAAIIQFSFTGTSPPSAGTNTAKYGFCHTTGGSYTAGDVIYDDGSALTKRVHVKLLVTTSSVSGSVSLNANGIYVLVGSTWTLKGDGNTGGGSGTTFIKVPFAFDNTTPTSTTSIADDDTIHAIRLVITTLFNGTAPTVAVATDGSSPVTLVTTSDFDITLAEQYGIDDITLLGTNEGGHIDVTVTPDSSTAGAGYVLVFYGTPSN